MNLGYIIGLGGMAMFLDGLFSLFIYTDRRDKRSEGQSFWRDHSMRLHRCAWGVLLVIAGAVLG